MNISMEEADEETGSEDEEWANIAAVKSLKAKVGSKLASKFKAQHKTGDEEGKEDTDSDDVDSDDEFYVAPPEYGD